jgi:xylulokinase
MDATWERTRETIAGVVDSLDGDEEVVGVGVTGQGGGLWLVGEDGRPVRPAALWIDGRAGDLIDEWRETGAYDALFDALGYGVFSGQAVPLVCWFAEHDPDALDRADAVVESKDWIKYRLTGSLASDPTDMSLAHWDPVAGAFADADDLPDAAAEPALFDLEPAVQSPTEVVGHVTPEAADATGLPEGVPVVSGMLDTAATAVGSGVAGPGATSAVVGTTLQIQRVLDAPRIEPPPVGYTLDLCVDGRGFRAMGAMTGTPNLDWIRETITDDAPFDEIEDAAREIPPGAEGVLSLPFLSESGEKAPFVEPAARAGVVGLEPGHDRAHLLRAVYEGLALSLRDCAEHIPGSADRIHLSGGGSRSDLLCQLFADALDAEVVVPAGEEFGALGVAAMAGVAVGVYPGLDSAAAEILTVERSYGPRPEVTGVYDDWYEVYTDTYEALREPWQKRAALLD